MAWKCHGAARYSRGSKFLNCTGGQMAMGRWLQRALGALSLSVASAFPGLPCRGQSATQPPPIAQQAAPTSLQGSGCEITRPPSQIIKACGALLEGDAKNAEALAQRANAYRQLGDNAAAFRDFNAAIAIDPNDS